MLSCAEKVRVRQRKRRHELARHVTQSPFGISIVRMKFSAKLVGGYVYFRRRLAAPIGGETRQTYQRGYGNATVSYRLGDVWSFRLRANFDMRWQAGHQRYLTRSWSASQFVGWQILRRPDLWAQLSVSYGSYYYDEPDYRRKQDTVVVAIMVRLNL